MATPARAPAGQTGFPDIPGIDRRRAERRLNGNRALFLRGLRGLRDDFADVADRTRADLAHDDLDGAAARLHTLRGVAANLSAEELAALVGTLERDLREHRHPPSERALARLEKTLERLLAALPEDVDAPPAAPAGPAPTVAPADLEALLAALAAHDLDAIERFRALEPVLAARHGADDVARLADAVDRLQFGIAAAQLRAWYGAPVDGAPKD